MTKEEILQYIKSELANENIEIYLDVDDYKIIAKALEQRACDDCISRFSAEQVVRNHYCGIPSKVYNELIVELDNLSLVTPIRPKGHWIKAELPARDAHECSECENLALVDEDGNERLTDFCPHCGAEMESENK